MLSSKFDTEVWYQLITNFDTEFKNVSFNKKLSEVSFQKRGFLFAGTVSEAKRNWKHPWFAIS